jgi:hypothetical protein
VRRAVQAAIEQLADFVGATEVRLPQPATS